VTAGPTREPLDGVRFISNPSSGRMGYAVARAAVRRGASVTLVTGPTELPAPFGADVVRVTTGEEMRAAVVSRFDGTDVVVKTAAVTDYRPAAVRTGKNKDAAWNIALEKVPNILEDLAPRRKHQVIVGFAAEVGNPESEGARKQASRGLDLVVANDISEPGSGFGSATNRAVFIHADGRRESLPLLPKTDLAERILDAVTPLLARTGSRA
jgi:phosphopantothenoylcysteine decarboxylase/phosphopantothenate--cysteine ligase